MPNFIARNYSGRTVAAGGTVRVYGSGFSGSTKAWLGNVEAVINDYEDGVIEVSAGPDSGDYTLYLGESSSNKVAIGTITVLFFAFRFSSAPFCQQNRSYLSLSPRYC